MPTVPPRALPREAATPDAQEVFLQQMAKFTFECHEKNTILFPIALCAGLLFLLCFTIIAVRYYKERFSGEKKPNGLLSPKTVSEAASEFGIREGGFPQRNRFPFKPPPASEVSFSEPARKPTQRVSPPQSYKRTLGTRSRPPSEPSSESTSEPPSPRRGA